MNRRRHPRLDINHSAVVQYGTTRYPGFLILNFSEGGLYLQSEDPSLMELLGQGFHQPNHRSRIIIDLQGTRHSVEVEVVYVTQVGLGITFLSPEPDLYDYLQNHRQRIQKNSAIPLSPPLQVNPAKDAILDRLHNKILEYLKSQFSRFPVIAKDSLLVASDGSKSSYEQADLFFVMTALERQIEKIRHDFFTGFEASFDELLKETVKTPVKEPSASQNLGLIDKDEFDDWLLLTGISHRLDSQLINSAHQLELALSKLLHKPVQTENNPISSLSLLSLFQQSMDIPNISQEAKRIVYEAFGKVMLGNIHRLYGEILTYLEEEGIATNPASEADRQVVVPIARQAAEQPHPTQTLSYLSSLLNLGEDKYPSGGNHAPEQFPVASRDQVMACFESISSGDGLPILTQLERLLHQAEDEPLALDPITRAAISTSEELLTAVKQDELFFRTLRELLDRLELLLIKEVVNDPTLLENSEHPGRRLLHAIEELAPYCGSGEGKGRGGDRILQGLERLYAGIESGALKNIVQVTERLEVLQGQQKELFERNRKLAIENFQRTEKLRRAYGRVKISLQERLLGHSVSVMLDRLFRYGWANLLIHTAMLHEQESREWKSNLWVVEMLRQLFRSDKPYKLLPDKQKNLLLVTLKKGFDDYPVHPEATDRLMVELRNALVSPEAAQPFIQNRITIDEKYLTRLFVGQVRFDFEESTASQVDQQWREQIEGLELGAWLWQRRKDAADRLVSLAWKSAKSDRYLLVDAKGIKVMETNIHQLAEQFATGDLVILDQGSRVLDRAIQRILGRTCDSVEQQISIDELTGLMNRRAFERVLNGVLHADGDSTIHHVLIMLDVDQFGLVNDLCGFAGGDKLLQSITNLLHMDLPHNAQLARTGDDEFSVLVMESNLDQGFQIAEIQRQAIDEFCYSWANHLVPVTASFGVVEFHDNQRTAGDLLKAASAACKIAKQTGRNCTRVYREDDKVFVEHQRLVKSVASIEDSLANDRLMLMAQVIQPLQNERENAHYEILLRVLDDQNKPQSPIQFIQAAEKYNLMRSVDRWVIRHFFSMVQGCSSSLNEIANFSINLSGQSITDHDFRLFLKAQINASPIPTNQLGFEITETAMVGDTRDAVRFIEEIREMGCRFYLDDFGSGYASFSYLKDLPVDYVKIDGIFIKDLLCNQASQTMVKSVAEIAHFTDRQAIAEFVEDAETAAALKQLGVDYIQGYHIGRPTPLHEIIGQESSFGDRSIETL